MRILILLLLLCSPALAEEILTVGSGGVDIYNIPRHPLTSKDKSKLHDTGGRRTGVVRGATLRLMERQTYEYGRSSYQGTIITSAGAVDATRRDVYRYTVAYVEVVRAPAQPHVQGKRGWIVLRRDSRQGQGWVKGYQAPVSSGPSI